MSKSDKFAYAAEAGVLDISKMRDAGLYPDDKRMAEGPVAVFECAQEIPCNPCEKACPKGCIRIGNDISGIPKLVGQCTGCGLCVSSCPGLSVFILNGTFKQGLGTVAMPYEFYPLPEKGEKVDALSRKGQLVCEGEIISVRKTGKGEVCHCLTVAVPISFIHEVRHIRRRNING